MISDPFCRSLQDSGKTTSCFFSVLDVEMDLNFSTGIQRLNDFWEFVFYAVLGVDISMEDTTPFADYQERN